MFNRKRRAALAAQDARRDQLLETLEEIASTLGRTIAQREKIRLNSEYGRSPDMGSIDVNSAYPAALTRSPQVEALARELGYEYGPAGNLQRANTFQNYVKSVQFREPDTGVILNWKTVKPRTQRLIEQAWNESRMPFGSQPFTGEYPE